jgi:hypothetical protein
LRPLRLTRTVLLSSALLAMLLAAAGCPSGADPVGGLSCQLPLQRGICAPLPDGFDLSQCRLYPQRDSTSPLDYPAGFHRRVEPDGGLPSPCPDGTITLGGTGFPLDGGEPGTLVCSNPLLRCPALAPYTALVCRARPRAILGEGLTAASLGGADGQMAAVWAGSYRAADAADLFQNSLDAPTVGLRWTLFDAPSRRSRRAVWRRTSASTSSGRPAPRSASIFPAGRHPG